MKSAEEEAENRLKKRVFVVVKCAPDVEEGERKFWLKNNRLSLSLSLLFFASSSAPVSSFRRCCCRE